MPRELTLDGLDDDDGLDGLTWAQLLWMGYILGDPERARASQSLTPAEAKAAYLDQLRRSEEYDQRKAQEAEARAQAPDLPPTERALHQMVADDNRRCAQESRARIRGIRIRAARRPLRVELVRARPRPRQYRPRRQRVSRGPRKARAPDDPDPEPEPVAVAPLGVAA
jgi:hypothetical protein